MRSNRMPTPKLNPRSKIRSSRDLDAFLNDEGRDEAFRDWCNELDEGVIQDEFGYEPGEFTIFPEHWRALFDEGLTPRQAWQRALDVPNHPRL